VEPMCPCRRIFVKLPVPGGPEFCWSPALGYIATFAFIGRVGPDATIAAAFGIIPLAVGIGFFVDHALIRRDAKAS